MNKLSPAIEIQKASISYNGKPVLADLDMVVPEKTAVGVIGPSGSGKSTLLRTLCRMNDRIFGFHVQGRIRVGGGDIYEKGVDVYQLRRNVGMVFQAPCVFPKSIFENAVFALKRLSPHLKKEFPQIAEQTLRDVFLWEEVKDRLHKPASTLSLGQQQRLVIARSLTIQPEILLMDEPTSSLDPKSSAAIEALIVSLKSRHTIVLVTHNLSQAQRITDDLIFLHQGRIRESGSTAEMFENPSCPETRDYLNRLTDVEFV
ncbi:MAG: phosphate ABC transporter ATP-binding protein [Nitrospinae bacterium]|jgi:phosphate transport system ATP-binding protein|nr:phosphate ABC transporter ATP-binding protein [Nitrospinota bacterium]MDA1108862.1 phosphate ABC transporter ATP-binding protein [Nitrospinota bacterium]